MFFKSVGIAPMLFVRNRNLKTAHPLKHFFLIEESEPQ